MSQLLQPLQKTPELLSSRLPSLPFELGSQRQAVRRRGGHRLLAEREREVFVVRPHLQQASVVRTPRLARLAGDVDRPRSIPVRDVQDLAVRGAVGFHGAGAAAALDRAEIELAQERMAERARVLLSPAAIE